MLFVFSGVFVFFGDGGFIGTSYSPVKSRFCSDF